MQTPTDILYIWDSVVKNTEAYLSERSQINFHTHHKVVVQWHCLHPPLMDNLKFHHRLLSLECIFQTVDKPIHLGNIYENDEDCFLWRGKKERKLQPHEE